MDEALALQRQVIQKLEEVRELDTRGYASAHIRRLRRVLQRVEDNSVSSRQARLMVGEALRRSNSGDLGRIESPGATPPSSPRLQWHDPVDVTNGWIDAPILFRTTTPPSTPP